MGCSGVVGYLLRVSSPNSLILYLHLTHPLNLPVSQHDPEQERQRPVHEHVIHVCVELFCWDWPWFLRVWKNFPYRDHESVDQKVEENTGDDADDPSPDAQSRRGEDQHEKQVEHMGTHEGDGSCIRNSPLQDALVDPVEQLDRWDRQQGQENEFTEKQQD